MVLDKLFLRDGEESVSLENMPPTILEPIANYLLTLPGYNKEKKGNYIKSDDIVNRVLLGLRKVGIDVL